MAKIIDSREKDLLLPDEFAMIKEFNEGKPVGEFAHVEAISDQFTWKKTFVNCWTGRPNSGKTTLLSFLALVKSMKDPWIWCIWSPEMINSYKIDNKIVRSSSDILDEFIHAKTGKNPYKHFVSKYNIPQMLQEEYIEALLWIQDHFIIIDPKDKTYKSLIDTYNYWYDKYGFDGWIIDPFKNVRFEIKNTMDIVLHHIFDDFKYCAVNTNSCINIVAHPKSVSSGKDARIDGKEGGAYKPVSQFDLLGGSAWDNSMDGIFSVYRPNVHEDPNDPRTYLYHFKQRKKHLVGETGVYRHIEYNILKNRYYFEGKCPIDGSWQQPINEEKKKHDDLTKAAKADQHYINFTESPEENPNMDYDKAPF